MGRQGILEHQRFAGLPTIDEYDSQFCANSWQFKLEEKRKIRPVSLSINPNRQSPSIHLPDLEYSTKSQPLNTGA
jgi:hypothetical protein